VTVKDPKGDITDTTTAKAIKCLFGFVVSIKLKKSVFNIDLKKTHTQKKKTKSTYIPRLLLQDRLLLLV